MHLRTPLLVLCVVFVLGVFVTGATNLYELIPWFDKLMHLAGGASIAWLAHRHFSHNSHTHQNPLYAWAILGVVAVVGIAWEVAEHTSSLFGQTYWPSIYMYFHGGDLTDTLIDLVLDLTGALAVFRFSRR
ncbi:MAG: hypothetical protein AAB463_02685 [Patescibacteria group bacterium]